MRLPHQLLLHLPRLTSSQTTTVATKTSDVAVIITADRGPTWLAVTDSSGSQIFSGMLPKGTTHSFDDSQLIISPLAMPELLI